MPNDVSLHFGSSGFDGVSTRAQVGVRPNSFFDSAWVAGHQLAVGAEHLLSDLLKALIELAPENFLDRKSVV